MDVSVSRAVGRVAFAALAVASACGAKLAIEQHAGEGPPLILLLAAVMVAARYGGPSCGLSATALAAVAATFFYFPPVGRFAIHSANDGVRLFLFVAEGVLLSTLMSSLRSARRIAGDATAQLTRSYEATIEAWSRALDLRDHETEGHSRRVTMLTLRLARAMGMDEGQLVHVRRGAMLHDIGKMGIPDAILLKPGPLTEEEWAIMRRHPGYAYEWLSGVAFLGPALDIPHSHHEKWDGSGYPLGLAGEAIPLAARIFAVVDVWDALTSDRPYRAAWSRDRAFQQIRALAGSHLDPAVVEVFSRTVAADDRASRRRDSVFAGSRSRTSGLDASRKSRLKGSTKTLVSA